MARLNALDIDKKVSNISTTAVARAEEAIALADVILTELDSTEILANLAVKTDARPDAQDAKKENDKQKGQLIETLAKKGTII